MLYIKAFVNEELRSETLKASAIEENAMGRWNNVYSCVVVGVFFFRPL